MSATLEDRTLKSYQCDLPKLNEVIDVLQPIQPRWYELFLYLGLKRDTLEKLCTEHPCDDHSSLIEALINWLQREDPLPSWEELLEVIQNVLMEGDIAIEIKKKLSKSGSEENNEDDFHQNINDEGIVFTKLLSVIAEKLGSSCFPELQHFLLNLKCPDGSAFIKSDYLYHHKTVNGLLSSLVTANLCTARDVDVLIHTLSGLKRGDLLTLISAYVPQITVGNPRSALPMREGSVVLKLSLPDALKKIDLGMVSAIKLDLCTICNLKEQPFLLQYIGWKTSPVTLFFQFRIACMMLVEKGLQSDSLHKLSENGIHCITICFNNTFVYYPF
jgi:hypothetical protein